MILVVDVGNTNITYGVFDGDELVSTFRMMSKTPRTSDEYGIMIREMLKKNDIDRQEIEGICVASVVPNIMHSLLSGLSKYVNESILTVGAGTKTGIKIITEAPKEIGPDRIVDAVGAYVKYGGPILVLDFGTATTYDYITEKGEFAAGITAPGLRISAKALWEDTAKLPEIEIKKPKSIMAQETISSMQAGLVYGQIGQTEYIINQVKKESGREDLKVVATGGLGRIIADETDMIQVYDPMLTLEGLKFIYEKNRKKS
ncbi:type III pantothenate kinase [Lacrimispora saccharolytica]|uniref:type III pantothenate kinase n=1 Tax=Lacrimispora saccharolytica TaxID=84030 RepID=UPI00265D5E6B|nr:type III pantothenate kinase [Lacrimispora saccharolytica]MBS7329278.1 type III pantothenate kinase [Lachnospiraceae bacterium]MCF2656597.1 type III pantothenate kinase [Lacrimispora saccharolytica]